MTRRDTITQLVRWLPEARDSGGGHVGRWINGGDHSKLLIYGPLWHSDCPKDKDGCCRSCISPFPELERCLEKLRAERPLQYDHLTWRHWNGHTTRKPVRFSKLRGSARRIGSPQGLQPNQEILIQGGALNSRYVLDCAIYTWPSWIHEPEVTKAIDYLADAYRGEPFLPRALKATPAA